VANGQFDVGIGAITITPERLSRVDFTYPAHRSGVAVVFRLERGLLASMANYGAAVAELAPLIAGTLGLALAMGVGLWWVERSRKGETVHESAVATLRDGVYWAVTTMTTVGYGDKTPKTNAGRAIAIFWMMTSLALVSVLSTAIVAKMTADQFSGARVVAESDLVGKRLAAVEASSGSEYLDARQLAYAKFPDIPSALKALMTGDADAVVNSVGALQYAVSNGFQGQVDSPGNVLVPAYMAFALRRGGDLKARLDPALARVTASTEWRRAETSYFNP